MDEFYGFVEKLRRNAAEAALLRDLTTDWARRDTYARLHDDLIRLADQVVRETNRAKK